MNEARSSSDIVEMAVAIVWQGRKGLTLLGEQRGGPFKGRVVGPGGIFEEGEGPVECVLRELREETGATALRRNIQRLGTLIVSERGIVIRRIHVMEIRRISGVIRETKPFIARWVGTAQIPRKLSIPGDESWLPLALRGRPFAAHAFYGQRGWRSFQYIKVRRLKRLPS